MVSSAGGLDQMVWVCGLDKVVVLCSWFLVFFPLGKGRKMVPAVFHFGGGRDGGSISLLFQRHLRGESRFHTIMSL